MTPTERQARITALRKELAELLDEEAAEAGIANMSTLKEECVALIRQNKAVEAVKLYRMRVGCGLRDAHDAVTAMK